MTKSVSTSKKPRVIGWLMSSQMTAQLACDALQMVLWRRKYLENVIAHTDTEAASTAQQIISHC